MITVRGLTSARKRVGYGIDTPPLLLMCLLAGVMCVSLGLFRDLDSEQLLAIQSARCGNRASQLDQGNLTVEVGLPFGVQFEVDTTGGGNAFEHRE